MDQQPIPQGRRREQRFWSELIRAELDSWEPRSLPVSFTPRSAPTHPDHRLIPVLAIVLMLVLVAIAMLSDVPRGLVSTVLQIRRSHPVGTPWQRLPATTAPPEPSDAAARGRLPTATPAESAPRPGGPAATSGPGSTPGTPGVRPGPGPGGGLPGAPAAPVAPPVSPSLPLDTPPLPPPPQPSVPPLPSPSPPQLPLPSLPTVPTVPTPLLPTPPLP